MSAYAKQRDHRSGSLLIVTLWIVTILSILAVAIARHLSLEVRITKYRMARAQAKALARSGVYLAIERLKQQQTPPETYDWLKSPWALPNPSDPSHPETWVVPVADSAAVPSASSGQIEITILDEERKLSLNKIADPAGTYIQSTTAHLLNSGDLAARIVDDIDVVASGPEQPAALNVDGVTGNGLEEDNSSAPPYKAKNSFMKSSAELLDIPGIAALPREQLTKLDELTSVYLPDQPKVNINTADLRLLTLWFDEANARILDSCRRGGSGAVFTVADITGIQAAAAGCFGVDALHLPPLTIAAGWGIFDVASTLFSVTSNSEVPLTPGMHNASVVRSHVDAVLNRANCRNTPPDSSKPCIVAWREG